MDAPFHDHRERRLTISVPPFKNTVLQHLDAATIGHLELRPVELELRREMEYPGSSIDNLFFIEEGVGSMTVTLEDGSQVEAGMFGHESVVGFQR